MAAQRLIVLIAILLSPSAVPRMQSSGGERWFVPPVPDPQRFRLDDHNSGARAATWEFGYPFVFYFQVGCEFRTKGGSMLFWLDLRAAGTSTTSIARRIGRRSGFVGWHQRCTADRRGPLCFLPEKTGRIGR